MSDRAMCDSSLLNRSPLNDVRHHSLGGALVLLAALTGASAVGCSAPASDTGFAPSNMTGTGMAQPMDGFAAPGSTMPATGGSDDNPVFDTGVNTTDPALGADGVPIIGNAVCGGSNVVGTIRDFTDQHPDFENLEEKGRAYGFEVDIVTDALGPDRKPVYQGGRGLTTSGPENFAQWYNSVDGVNSPVFFEIVFTQDPATGVSFFDSAPQGGFFPIDDNLYGNGPFPPGNTVYTHNYHFTFEFHTRFLYNPGDVFTFRGDDDVWVYIDDRRVCDLGGVHGQLTCAVELDSLGLIAGTEYPFDFFFAERHILDSNFRIETNLVFEACDLLR